MSNKIKSITILFEEDVEESYIDLIEKTALCYKGVMKVEREVSDVTNWAIETRIKSELHRKLFDAIYKK